MAHVDTRIRRVTVYRNGALVIRRGLAEVGPVEITGLPLLFSSDSLRIRPAAGQVVDLRETCVLEWAPGEGRPPDREAQRAALDLRAHDLAGELARLTSTAEAIGRIGPAEPPRGARAERPDAARWLALHELASRRLEALEIERERLRRALRRNSEVRSRLEREAQTDPQGPRFTRGITFHLQAEGGPLTFDLEYFVEAARWFPRYKLELEGGQGVLTLEASVAQATGESWSDTRLAFSTADLRREATLPEITSWRIGHTQPDPRPAFRPLPGDLHELFAAYRQARAAEPERAPGEPAGATQVFLRAIDELSPEPAPEPSDEYASEFTVDDIVAGETGDLLRSSMPAPAPAEQGPAIPTFAVAGAATAGATFGGPRAEIVCTEPTLPERLRYSYLRLAGPDEPEAGTLQPVDPFTRLWALVTDHQLAQPEQLATAITALLRARRQLQRQAPPSGTSSLSGCHFHHVFEAGGRYEIPADGGWHGLAVDGFETPIQTELRAVPRESPAVYRFCRVRGADLVALSAGPLPTGPVDVYRGGSFLVTAQLDGTGGGAGLDIGLGIEPAVRIIERWVKVQASEKGLVSHTSVIDHRVGVRVRSGLPVPATVRLFDRLPVPDDNQRDLEVSLLASDPEPISDDRSPLDEPLQGGLHWTLPIAPGGTETLTYRYRVQLPAKATLHGGNRRE